MSKTGNYQVHEAMTGSSPKAKRLDCMNSPEGANQPSSQRKKTSVSKGHRRDSRRQASRRGGGSSSGGGIRLDEIGYNHSVVYAKLKNTNNLINLIFRKFIIYFYFVKFLGFIRSQHNSGYPNTKE